MRVTILIVLMTIITIGCGQKQINPHERLPCPENHGVIFGTVTDSLTGKPIWGGSVHLVGTQRGAMVEQNGHYRIRCITPGKYTLRFTSIEHNPSDLNDIIIKPNATIEINRTLSLKPDVPRNITMVRRDTSFESENGVMINLVALSKAGPRGDIRGTITYQATGEPVAGVTVSIIGMEVHKKTSPLGFYAFDGINPGKYKLLISDGSLTVSTSDFTVVGGYITRVDQTVPWDRE